jgi:hypothetical protein
MMGDAVDSGYSFSGSVRRAASFVGLAPERPSVTRAPRSTATRRRSSKKR